MFKVSVKKLVTVPILLISVLLGSNHDLTIASAVTGTSSAKPWRWTVFIGGAPDALMHVRCVQYTLDPSFPNPHRTVCQRGAQDRPFASTGLAWGSFTVSVQVRFDDNTVKSQQYTVHP